MIKPDWERIKNQIYFPNTLKSLLYYTSDLSKFKPKNPAISHSLKIWSQIRKHFKWNQISTLTPLTGSQTVSGKTYQQWNQKGIYSIQNLYIDKLFLTFQQLRNKYNLDNKEFFKYLQIRNLVKNIFPSFPNQPPESPVDNLLLNDPLKKRSISKRSNALSTFDCTTTLEH